MGWYRPHAASAVCEHAFGIYDIFEGTEQIQQLVISRAISGLHIR